MAEKGIARNYFQAHETGRADQLQGLPLATFAQRALGFLVDFVVVLALWIPLELAWSYFVP